MADEPTKLIKLRVHANAATVETLADIVASSLEDEGLELMDKSEVKLCRSPKQTEGHVYLTFCPGGEMCF